MSSTHYVVSQREHAWLVSYKGSEAGPFPSRDAAIAEAIAEAKRSDDASIEVVVHDADLKSETVWRQGDQR